MTWGRTLPCRSTKGLTVQCRHDTFRADQAQEIVPAQCRLHLFDFCAESNANNDSTKLSYEISRVSIPSFFPRVWCKRFLPGQRIHDVLCLGMAGMRGSMVFRLRPCMPLSPPPPPAAAALARSCVSFPCKHVSSRPRPGLGVLRPYQDDVIRRAVSLYGQGTRRLLVPLATGLGKTVIFTHLPQVRGTFLVESENSRVLFRLGEEIIHHHL